MQRVETLMGHRDYVDQLVGIGFESNPVIVHTPFRGHVDEPFHCPYPRLIQLIPDKRQGAVAGKLVHGNGVSVLANYGVMTTKPRFICGNLNVPPQLFSISF